MNVILASHNQGKVSEFQHMLADFDLNIQSLADYPEIPEVEETGTTFEENARLKAETIANRLNMVALADDSGLVVPALNGEPGVYSARYSGAGHDDAANNQKLLKNLAASESQDRSAYFVSCLVLAYPNQASLVVEGRSYGSILTKPQGDNGFGYDPIFYVPDEGKSFAELPMDRKNEISHRSNALHKLIDVLPAWIKEIEQDENSSNE